MEGKSTLSGRFRKNSQAEKIGTRREKEKKSRTVGSRMGKSSQEKNQELRSRTKRRKLKEIIQPQRQSSLSRTPGIQGWPKSPKQLKKNYSNSQDTKSRSLRDQGRLWRNCSTNLIHGRELTARDTIAFSAIQRY